MGNINQQNFSEIWHGIKYNEFRAKAKYLPKTDPYFSDIDCLKMCDNMMHNENIHYLSEKNLPANCYIFKHSTRCPISAAAAENVKQIHWKMPLYWINIIEQRDFSDWVASNYCVKHESPQLLQVEDSKVVKVWNHREITKEAVES